MQTLLAPRAKRREVLGESHEGWTASFYVTSACEADLHLDDGVNELIYFSV